jgi:hypothetical protein
MAGIDRLTDLTIRAASMEPRVDGNPVRGVGWLETAAAMGKMKPEASDVVRALYLHDAPSLRRVLARLVVRLSGKAGLSAAMQHALAAASFQALVALRPCAHCDGLGRLHTPEIVELDDTGDWLITPAVDVPCVECEGEGLDHVDASAVRDMLGVGVDVWELLVGEPFRECYRDLRHLHEQAAATLQRRLR